MSKKLRNFLIAGVTAFALIAALLGGAYWASQQGPAFYDQALTSGSASAKTQSDALLHELAALASDVRRPGQWHALFTIEQINGWLAYDVQHNHPKLFPPTVSEPRLAIENGRAQIAFAWRKFPWSTIVSLETEIYLRETNVVAIRICHARAGLLPLPIAGLLNELIASARSAGLESDEEEIEGDPLLVVTLPWADDSASNKLLLSLESLEVNQGEIYVAGHSQHGPTVPHVATKPAEERPTPAEDQPEKVNLQR